MTELSRRTFAESLALTALGSVFGVSPDAVRIPAWKAPADAPTPTPAALAKVLTQAIKAQYGSRLSAKDLDVIRQQIQNGLDRVARLKAVPLTNADEPDFVFSASPHSRAAGG